LGTAGTEQTFLKSYKKLTRRQDEAAALKAYGISLVFLFCNIHTQTGYYTKEISRWVANFLSCKITKYYYGQHMTE